MLLAMAAIAIAVKILLLFVLLPWYQGSSPADYQADRFPDWYDLLAQNIADGNGYRFFPETTATMLRTPAWPLVLAGLFSLFGPGIASVKVFNLLCSIGTGALTFKLAERIAGNRLIASLAALIAFLHPAVIIADSRGGVESFFMVFVAAFTLLAFTALEDGRLKSYVTAGFVLGFALLIKSTAVVFAPCLFLAQFVAKPTVAGFRRAFVTTAMMSIVATAVLGPWIVRNYLLSGEFVPTMSVGGMSSYSGYYIAKNRGTGRDQFVLDREASEEMGKLADASGLRHRSGYYVQFYSIADEVAFYRSLGEKVRQAYRDDPSLFAKVMADNAAGFWIRGRSARATALNMVLVLPFLAFAIAGAWIARRRGLLVLPIVFMVIAFYAAHVPILGQARYHVPLIPMLGVLVSLLFLPLVAPRRVA